MKIVLTGSLGHIGKPLAQQLVAKGNSVTVISSKAEKQNDIEALGAKAAIGLLEDAAFLAQAFKDADVVYLMEPPVNYFDHSVDIEIYWPKIASNYVQAIRQCGVTKLIHLSSIGAHTNKGVGMLETHHDAENVLQQLPDEVSIKFMRPVGFYYNMLAFIPTIKAQGVIIQNNGGNEKEPWVSPLDIAAVIAEEMEKPFKGRTVRYIASDEASPNEVAKTLGAAIGKPELSWLAIPDEQFLAGLLKAGFHPKAARGLVAMNAARFNGLYADYHQHKPALGKIKLTDFAKEFAKVYHQ